MKKVYIFLMLGIILGSISPVYAESEISVESLPPVVIYTFPQAGDISVDPLIKEIRVTFSKDMMTEKMWSWVMASKELFPKIVGDVYYLKDKRTCVAPVALEPGRVYAIWFNSEKNNSFRDTDNNPLVPYFLVFETKK